MADLADARTGAVYMADVEAEIDELASATKRYGESKEPWKVRHEEASACFEVERQVGYGIYLFDRLAAAEKAMRESGVLKQRIDIADSLDRAWEWWLAPCDDAEAAIHYFEALNYHVEPAKGFRERCTLARRRVRTGARAGSWRAAVQDPSGKLFGKPAVTEEELRRKTGPFPE